MTDHCPDCGRPFVIAHEGAIETHCLANRKDDFLGRVMCKDNTIARLRLELAAAKADSRLTKVEAATITDAIRYPDNGALHCRWCSAGSQEAHESRCWYLEQVKRADAARALVDRLSERGSDAASVLSTAERDARQSLMDALDDWVNAPDGNRRTDDALIDAHQEYWKRVRALRAQKAEG